MTAQGGEPRGCLRGGGGRLAREEAFRGLYEMLAGVGGFVSGLEPEGIR